MWATPDPAANPLCPYDSIGQIITATRHRGSGWVEPAGFTCQHGCRVERYALEDRVTLYYLVRGTDGAVRASQLCHVEDAYHHEDEQRIVRDLRVLDQHDHARDGESGWLATVRRWLRRATNAQDATRPPS